MSTDNINSIRSLDNMELKYQNTTELIIKAFYKVYNELGYGFLEKVYENALYLELISLSLVCEKQKQIIVYYHDQIVGEYYSDLLVNDNIIIELKAAECLHEMHEVQLVNYLKATNLEIGLLLNFGKKAEFRRKVFSNYNKKKSV